MTARGYPAPALALALAPALALALALALLLALALPSCVARVQGLYAGIATDEQYIGATAGE